MAITEVSTDQTDNVGLIEQLMRARFDTGTRRSDAYKNGTRSIFHVRIIGGRLGPLPYPQGTAHADAYFAGQQEGHALFAAYLAKSTQAAKTTEGQPA